MNQGLWLWGVVSQVFETYAIQRLAPGDSMELGSLARLSSRNGGPTSKVGGEGRGWRRKGKVGEGLEKRAGEAASCLRLALITVIIIALACIRITE